MPLKAIKRRICGSPEVKEVKTETYICNRCESGFKHVDPGRVTVAPTFCSRGTQ